MTRTERLGMWGLVVLFVAACALGVRATRPDTRLVVGLNIDSAATSAAITHFVAHFPNESAVCFYGIVRDTVFVAHDTLSVRVKVIDITRTVGGITTHVTPFSVDYADDTFGCVEQRGLVGRGHSHLYVPLTRPCELSDIDVLNLASDHTSLFHLVFCPYGRAALLWQDGRRDTLRWGHEQQ